MILMTILQLYDPFLSYNVNVKLLALNSRFVTIVVTNLNFTILFVGAECDGVDARGWGTEVYSHALPVSAFAARRDYCQHREATDQTTVITIVVC